MKTFAAVVTMLLLFAFGATAETTNALSDAEIQGRVLVQKILSQWPADNYTNSGVFQIRDAQGKKRQTPVTCKTMTTATNWSSIYEATPLGDEWLTITHHSNAATTYHLRAQNGKEVDLAGNQLMFPFAGSDFWFCDLGLEFFHWPQQKVIKKENHRSCGCQVLESINPNPTTNGYSRVVSWVDTESLGIVEAYAYDAKGKQLKIFYPKNIKPVNGQYQVQTLIMENVQTGSKSRLEFDLKK